jgi:hypothetical protein
LIGAFILEQWTQIAIDAMVVIDQGLSRFARDNTNAAQAQKAQCDMYCQK